MKKSKFLTEKISLVEEEDVEIVNDETIDSVKDDFTPPQTSEENTIQDVDLLSYKSALEKDVRDLTTDTFGVINKLNDLLTFTKTTDSSVIENIILDVDKFNQILSDASLQDNVNIGMYNELSKLINPELKEVEDIVQDRLQDLDTDVNKDESLNEGKTKWERDYDNHNQKILDLMRELRDVVDDWVDYVEGMNQDAATDRRLEKAISIAKQIEQEHHSWYKHESLAKSSKKPHRTSNRKLKELYLGVMGELDEEAEDLLWSIAKKLDYSKYDYEMLLDDVRNLRGREWIDIFTEDGLDSSLLDEFKKLIKYKEEDEEDVDESLKESKKVNKIKSNKPINKSTEAITEDLKPGTKISDVLEPGDDFDIGDDIFDWGENIDNPENTSDGYNKVMKFFCDNIDIVNVKKDWYSTCKVSEFIEKNIDKINGFLNEVYEDEYQPQNLEKQYTTDDDEFYDIYMDMMSGLLRGSFATSDYDILYDYLTGKKKNTVPAGGNIQYIYQFPKDMTEQDIKDCKNYNLKYLGRVGEDGYQPGDVVIQGSKPDLERYSNEYIGGYDLHPDFLYKAEDFDTEVLESIDSDKLTEANADDLETIIKLAYAIGITNFGELEEFKKQQSKEQGTDDLKTLLINYKDSLGPDFKINDVMDEPKGRLGRK